VKLPRLDPVALTYRVGVPKPEQGSRRGESKYTAIFAKLHAVGMSVEAPIAYIGTLKSQAKKLTKAGPCKYSVLRVNATTCGVWRDA
jgi:hypothetical protein